jgi:PLP dependent protein
MPTGHTTSGVPGDDPLELRIGEGLPHSPDVERRRAELAARSAVLDDRVRSACAAAGRDRAEVTVIAVTKTFPASDIALLAELGITDIGENRDREAAPKAAACAELSLTWHFVGQLQTNKCRSVASYAHVIHSVDRLRLVDALAQAAVRAGRELACLIQVDLTSGVEPNARADLRPARGQPAKTARRGGAPLSEVSELADAVAAAAGLRLAGVMAIAPLHAPAAPAFARLADIAAGLRARYPEATVVSAGMSGDLEEAIAHGATHVRVGTSLLGSRPPVR